MKTDLEKANTHYKQDELEELKEQETLIMVDISNLLSEDSKKSTKTWKLIWKLVENQLEQEKLCGE